MKWTLRKTCNGLYLMKWTLRKTCNEVEKPAIISHEVDLQKNLQMVPIS